MDLTRALKPDGDRRAKILGELIRATRKEKPGVRGRENQVVYGPRVSGEQARNRRQALARPMVEAANQLTGQSYVSPEDWFDVWRENRRNPKILFLEDEA